MFALKCKCSIVHNCTTNSTLILSQAFGEFCNRHFVPRILIRDNIPENVGGALAEECHCRGVKNAFSCPYTPEQIMPKGTWRG
jgi:hypothetical protein